jgi:hypothetical protein
MNLSHVNNNVAHARDGPLYTDKSQISFTDSVISGNRAGVGGAGIYMVSGNTLTLNNVNVTDNEVGRRRLTL